MRLDHLNLTGSARALSITGGGVRGLFAASVLAILERSFQRNVHDFDVICGTSVGGIIAIGIACGIPASRIHSMLLEQIPTIFGKPSRLNPAAFRTSRYKSEPLRQAIAYALGDHANRNIRDLNRNILVTSVAADSNSLAYFSNVEHIGAIKCLNAPLIDVALATSAAPTYFAPHRIGDKYFLDGGIASNNPDIEALRYCISVLSRAHDQVKILSIGTGTENYEFKSNGYCNFGSIAWIGRHKIIDRLMNLQEGKSSSIVFDLIGDNYRRIDFPASKHIALDETNKNVLVELSKLGESVINEAWRAQQGQLSNFIR